MKRRFLFSLHTWLIVEGDLGEISSLPALWVLLGVIGLLVWLFFRSWQCDHA